MSKLINSVFNCTTAIGAEQIGQRSYVDRLELKERLLSAICQDSVLVVAGYSRIGKTTLINLATTPGEFRRAGAPFRTTVRVLADNLSKDGILSGIYDEIAPYGGGRKPDTLTPTTVAEFILSNQLLLIVDGVNCLYEDQLSSKALFNLCKIWTDLPRRAIVQSKMILVAPGLSSQTSLWLSQAGAGKSLPHEQIDVLPWSSQDLFSLVDTGARRLGISFTPDLQKWMAKIACGLPATMTLVAALSSRHANTGRDEIARGSKLRVELSDLHGILGESHRFKNVLLFDDRIETLSVSALFALYILGMNGGVIRESEIYQLIQRCGFIHDDISQELESLISVNRREEETWWSIKELSYGTFAFLRLYHRSKLNVPDAEQISKALVLLIEEEIPNQPGIQEWGIDPQSEEVFQGGTRRISILFLAADPTDASRLRLGKEFREIDEQLTLAKKRDNFKLELPQLSLRSRDIARTLLNTQPQIVHFSGHGTSQGALCFENETGQAHLVQSDALAALFEQFADHVNCVVLNACFSRTQAEAIAKHIEYVIGMNKAIGDDAAIAFTIGFYQALGAGRSIGDAYKFGCIQIRLQSIPEHLTPVLIKKEQA
ncbi:MAG: CHAT domain-containing protein [Caldilineaceae bacterium]